MARTRLNSFIHAKTLLLTTKTHDNGGTIGTTYPPTPQSRGWPARSCKQSRGTTRPGGFIGVDWGHWGGAGRCGGGGAPGSIDPSIRPSIDTQTHTLTKPPNVNQPTSQPLLTHPLTHPGLLDVALLAGGVGGVGGRGGLGRARLRDDHAAGDAAYYRRVVVVERSKVGVGVGVRVWFYYI